MEWESNIYQQLSTATINSSISRNGHMLRDRAFALETPAAATKKLRPNSALRDRRVPES